MAGRKVLKRATMPINEAGSHHPLIAFVDDVRLVANMRMRSDADYRIKELKCDFGFDSFNLKDFYAT
jgi:hypothetical protein